MLKLLGLILGALIMSSAFASDSQIVRFDLTPSIKDYLRKHEFDITGVNYNTMVIEALLTQEEFRMIQAQNANIRYSFPRSLMAAPDNKYLNPDEIEDFLRQVHARYPAITEVISIGKSLEGRDILAIKISDN